MFQDSSRILQKWKEIVKILLENPEKIFENPLKIERIFKNPSKSKQIFQKNPKILENPLKNPKNIPKFH